MTTVLFCTVGGSHQPVVTAIRDVEADRVCFVCTGPDPQTGRSGSESQVVGTGVEVETSDPGDKPLRTSIPALAGLSGDRFEVALVPADQLEEAFDILRRRLSEARERDPDARLVADYTGGTKTMSAALVLAALETEGAELRLVTGARADLVRVQSGTEYGYLVSLERVRLERELGSHLAAWRQFGYGAAAAGLDSVTMPKDGALRARLAIAKDMSRAFDAWDRFDHAEAWRLVDMYGKRLAPDFKRTFVPILRRLASRQGDDPAAWTEKDPLTEPALLLDLWSNALRLAARGGYDDAVARLYRLIEWTAQWVLRREAGIDTSNVDPRAVPEELRGELSVGRNGEHQAALAAAWRLVERCTEGPAADFAGKHRGATLDHIQVRNHSILAHGHRPIGRARWEKFQDWAQADFFPALLAEAKRAGIRALPPQLPTTPCWDEH